MSQGYKIYWWYMKHYSNTSLEHFHLNNNNFLKQRVWKFTAGQDCRIDEYLQFNLTFEKFLMLYNTLILYGSWKFNGHCISLTFYRIDLIVKRILISTNALASDVRACYSSRAPGGTFRLFLFSRGQSIGDLIGIARTKTPGC